MSYEHLDAELRRVEVPDCVRSLGGTRQHMTRIILSYFIFSFILIVYGAQV